MSEPEPIANTDTQQVARPGAALRRRYRTARRFITVGVVMTVLGFGSFSERQSASTIYSPGRTANGSLTLKPGDARTAHIAVSASHRSRTTLLLSGEETRVVVSVNLGSTPAFTAAEQDELAMLAARATGATVTEPDGSSLTAEPAVTSLSPKTFVWSTRAWVVDTLSMLPAAGVATAFLAVLCMVFYAMRALKYTRPGYCRDCGYNLEGNETGRCPECGAATKWTTGTRAN